MASVKKFLSNLVIQTPVGTGVTSNITLDTDLVIITGNLAVQGNTTTVSSNNLAVTDNVIVLNQGETGGGVTRGNAGILIDRGSQIAAQLQWNESLLSWQISGNSAGYANILTSSSGNVGLAAVFDDKAPVLGGNLNVNGQAFYANIDANVMINGNMQIISTISTSLSTTLYSAAPNSGASGMYVVNQSVVNEELVTKSRAVGFSLLL